MSSYSLEQKDICWILKFSESLLQDVLQCAAHWHPGSITCNAYDIKPVVLWYLSWYHPLTSWYHRLQVYDIGTIRFAPLFRLLVKLISQYCPFSPWGNMVKSGSEHQAAHELWAVTGLLTVYPSVHHHSDVHWMVTSSTTIEYRIRYNQVSSCHSAITALL